MTFGRTGAAFEVESTRLGLALDVEDHLAQRDAEFADFGTVDQAIGIEQVHPVIEAHPHHIPFR